MDSARRSGRTRFERLDATLQLVDALAAAAGVRSGLLGGRRGLLSGGVGRVGALLRRLDAGIHLIDTAAATRPKPNARIPTDSGIVVRIDCMEAYTTVIFRTSRGQHRVEPCNRD